jgi:hypothetical protein
MKYVRGLIVLIFAMTLSIRGYGQWGGVAQGIADAQERDLERQHQLQMQRDAEKTALEIARIQAQNATARANDISTASAQTLAKDVSASGNNFLEICSSLDISPDKMNAADVANMHRCEGFMQGLRDGVAVATAVIRNSNPSVTLKGSISDLGICVPDQVNLLQIIRVAIKYIRDHPEQAHLPSAALVFTADLQAFPCAPQTTVLPAQKP